MKKKVSEAKKKQNNERYEIFQSVLALELDPTRIVGIISLAKKKH